jgi:dolichyl-phosphate-mannose--protein O-mannosyl transferase
MKKSRKGGRRQHLAKVGTRDEARQEQHRERDAVADTMGMGGAASWVKWVALFIGAIVLIGAVVTLIALD